MSDPAHPGQYICGITRSVPPSDLWCDDAGDPRPTRTIVGVDGGVSVATLDEWSPVEGGAPVATLDEWPVSRPTGSSPTGNWLTDNLVLVAGGLVLAWVLFFRR